MNKDEKEKTKTIASFRFGVIADFASGMKLHYGQKEELIKQKISCEYRIPFSSRSRITRSTLLNWIRIYKKSGEKIEGLVTKKRIDLRRNRVLSPKAQLAIQELKQCKPYLRIPIDSRIETK